MKSVYKIIIGLLFVVALDVNAKKNWRYFNFPQKDIRKKRETISNNNLVSMPRENRLPAVTRRETTGYMREYCFGALALAIIGLAACGFVYGNRAENVQEG